MRQPIAPHSIWQNKQTPNDDIVATKPTLGINLVHTLVTILVDSKAVDEPDSRGVTAEVTRDPQGLHCGTGSITGGICAVASYESEL